ncbi:heme lyase CcmF/NrfE family subunit [Granulicella sibirica]|uniref:Cytochrome c heme lyase subunit CcmF n=1 Tax=Granulicella sibirica TaxID=2479048 RepID=A0A4Q0T0D5_9BACT|nr:cytochrome c-type biogenesis CcmF C-terminal domain-containing protein [Granulicella sibirica]RXH56637.1 Cytochrome c heme lyase subunit CcmF [Granulicella sibirica]
MPTHPMPEFGSFSLLLALTLSVYTLAAGALALRRPSLATGDQTSSRLGETARRAGISTFVVMTCAAFALAWAAFTNDFSVSYILAHTNRDLHPAYKFSALWSGQEGSLLLWAWLLSAYGFVLRIRHRVDVRLSAYASTILSGVQVFFLLLLNFAAPPFAIQPGPLAQDGHGLNPLLQYPEMVIHPPMLYLGYVGFSVPFAFALGALMMRYPGEKWIHITRRWTMVTWLFLTCGIFLGAHWAYSVLGWGGYWGWDPVENASLMPWLTGTAFLHSVMMQEKRGMMKNWNVWLIFSTFLLTILGTLLTRSGLVSSVHAFAQSSIGEWFYGFILIVLAVCLFTFFKNRDHLVSENRLESLVSRESSFLFNNLILLVACFTVLWGTLFPVLSEYVKGEKATVGAPFYNRVNIPIGLFLLFLTGLGPLLAWRSTSIRAIRRNFVLPGIAMAVTLVGLMIAGIRPWNDGDDMHATIFSLMAFTLSAGVVTAISSEFLRGMAVVRTQTGKNLFASAVTLTHRNTRRYGGYLVHFGIVVMFIGIAGGAFNQSKEQEMGFGDTMLIGPYRIVCQSFTQDSNPNYDTEFAILDAYKGKSHITRLNPEKRFYNASQTYATMVANHSTLENDLYVIYEGKNPDTDKPIIKVFINPLIAWIWIGVAIVVAGTFLALVPALKPGATRTRQVPESQTPEVLHA